jgi:hypothetical protein
MEESYLAGDTSGPLILNNIVSKWATLETPESAAGQGIITATLTWGSEPDVDLHIYEPGGTHVDYRNWQGVSGYLDVDDTDGFGSEHYFVDCSTVQLGTYHFGVNYFTGTSPETAHINIQAGLKSKFFFVDLPAALGSSGNDSPKSVGDVVVTQDQSGNYKFDIP